MAANARTIVLWGATLASQPDLAPHLIKARKRGASVIHIDTRRTEASRHADDVFLLPPGTDAALALALAQTLIQENLCEQTFIDRYTLGFAQFTTHIQQYTPEWAATITGIEPERIRALARRYATQSPAMIVLGGSSMFKHQHGWEPARAISCLPALTGQLGIAGAGLGPRHGASPESTGYADVLADITRKMPAEAVIPSHMTTITQAVTHGQLDVLFVLGSNMLSMFADANELARGLAQVKLIVSYDLFMNATARRWLILSCLPPPGWKILDSSQTATHIYLMEHALTPAGECRSLITLLRELAQRLNIANVFPWQNEEEYVNAFLGAQKTETGAPLTVDILRQHGGYWQKNNLSHAADSEWYSHSYRQQPWFL